MTEFRKNLLNPMAQALLPLLILGQKSQLFPSFIVKIGRDKPPTKKGGPKLNKNRQKQTNNQTEKQT